jgi:hypothetical protein
MTTNPTNNTNISSDHAATSQNTKAETLTSEERINELLASAGELYKQSGVTARKLLNERVELGRVLIRLKDVVGYGNFLDAFKQWTEEGKIPFSLKTGHRAMSYAKLEGAGKFVDTNGLDIVTNLADAERLRKVEAAEAERLHKAKEAKKNAEETPPTEEDGEDDSDHDAPAELKKSQIRPKAKTLVRPLIEACCGYDSKSKQVLLEELIELLTEEYEKCSN